ncbi:S-adenosylmethionine:tRNA ribosyltransferase-isomerase [Salmonella enterica]|nr:S-adenosylmethionine:tRNA ribosyltransferase-isomerase [Salmonella enterica]
MPSITVYTTASHRLDEGAFAEFSASLANLTKEILQAKENNIHITYLTAEIGYGTPVYVEAKLRQEIFRSEPVMNEFLHQVDLLIKQRIGVVARIRCFLCQANNIFAKN